MFDRGAPHFFVQGNIFADKSNIHRMRNDGMAWVHNNKNNAKNTMAYHYYSFIQLEYTILILL